LDLRKSAAEFSLEILNQVEDISIKINFAAHIFTQQTPVSSMLCGGCIISPQRCLRENYLP
jgi:hypothetical protein